MILDPVRAQQASNPFQQIGTGTNPYNPPLQQVEPVRDTFVPTQVILKGWSTFGSHTGLSQGEAKAVGITIKGRLAPNLQDLITGVFAPFQMNRQTILKITGGKERVWEVKNAIADSLARNPLTVLGNKVYAIVEKPQWKKKQTATVAKATAALQHLVGQEQAALIVPDFRANIVSYNRTVMGPQTAANNQGTPIEMIPVGKLCADGSWRWLQGPLSTLFPQVSLQNLLEAMEKADDE